MSIAQGLATAGNQVNGKTAATAPDVEAQRVLRRGFGVEFSVVSGQSGEPLYRSPDQPDCDWTVLGDLCRAVGQSGRPEFIGDEPPFLLLALPLSRMDDAVNVAVGAFVTRRVAADDDVSQAARMLGLDWREAACWASRQTPWTAEALKRVADLVLENLAGRRRLKEADAEAESLSVNLAATYEEISLLYRIIQNLRISDSDEDLGRATLQWMADVLPAEGLAIQFVPIAEEGKSVTHQARSRPQLLTYGCCPVDNEQFSRLVDHLQLRGANRPIVVNRSTTRKRCWPFPEVRQAITVPLAEGENLFGWLAAFNHVDGAEFGTVEASLLSSVGAILGIHGGNIELYRQQAELLAGVVRALSSAIDAKDPYTCGHSDRVARVSVRLARELGCDAETLNTVYLSGLLHDVGKIGINDSVLRKPGKLSEAEYEHIKTHVQIGHKILMDLKKLDGVLPVVLHHHESWDGDGYPHRLPGEDIPLTARILAVADAFDAMGSDRPYRKGLPDEKIDEIFRAGAGKQWDPAIVDAFFRCRDEIREIMRAEQKDIDVYLKRHT